ncbi:MAG: hypothetical protein ACJ8C4_15165 [Gemmataceae bacterium]
MSPLSVTVMLLAAAAISTVAWLIAEAKGSIGIRLTFGIATMALAFAYPVYECNWKTHFRNRRVYGELREIQRQLTQGHITKVKSALEEYGKSEFMPRDFDSDENERQMMRVLLSDRE